MFTLKNSSDHPQIISATYLIRLIGIIGFLFPVILAAGAVIYQHCELEQSSISDYYHTDMRNVFVGVLWAIALCFLAYRGYCQIDRVAGILVAIFALGVSLFPTSVGPPFTDCLPHSIDMGIVGKIHLAFATLLFSSLAFFSLFLFTQTNPNASPTRQKLQRNTIYRICGIAIIVFMVLIAIYLWFLEPRFPHLSEHQPIFWLETLCLWAFSVSWLTKGGFFFKDS